MQPSSAGASMPLLPDVIGPNLDLLFVGINPSLISSETGCHYARPGNRFWPALYAAGITRVPLKASQQRELLRLGCGLTNLVARPTAKASDLDESELRNGFRKLAEKVARLKVRHLAFLGVTAFRAATGNRSAKIGSQVEPIGSAIVHVLPNPSGLNAHYQLDDFERLFRELAEIVWG